MKAKFLMVIALAALLSGCYQVASNVDVRKAVHFCKGVEKVDELSIHFDGYEYVKCLDGTTTFLGKVNLD